MKRLFRAAAALVLSLYLTACGGGGDVQEPPKVPEPQEINLMSYGLEVKDANGLIVATATGPSLHYIGQASYTRTDTAWPGASAGIAHLVFTINSPGGACLPVIEAVPGDGQAFKVVSVRLVSGTSYEIAVLGSAGSATKVHCFAPLAAGTAPAEAWGARVMGPSTDPRPYFDSTRNPLLVDNVVPFAAFTQSGGTGNAPPDGTLIQRVSFVPPSSRVGVLPLGLGRTVYSDTFNGYFGFHSIRVRVEAGSIDRVTGPKVGAIGPAIYDSGPNHELRAENILVVNLNRYLP